MLESRHLVGLFLLLVVIFGVVFTLGYLLGRSQYDTKAARRRRRADGIRYARRPSVGEIQDPAGVRGRASPDKKIPTGTFIIPPIRKRPRITCSRLQNP